ncbi:hypothetical protein FHT40_005772 [Mycolicibacterium sp. BK556]|uniref:two pore domain potassium channel family protein n=1 Tax=unclassified Mycolicibacterium TaxID=2636767 RepID=UPI001617377C|nr:MULTISPECIES: two pore domain potassium channel family protein [unclassified Mycolicibacterium]MBB3606083.1 hypothetical protein [Mycolicibacterium sp. BK556]MBB3632660.1 hypothetical protein [Mycolicibacterium sp. BK607]
MPKLAERIEDCKKSRNGSVAVLTQFCQYSVIFSAATWLGLNDSVKGRRHLAYVGVWMVGLLALLKFGPFTGVAAFVVVVAGLYRLQDLVFASLDNVFGLTRRGDKWRSVPAGTSVVINLLNIIQVIVVFALAYQNVHGGGNDGFEHKDLPDLTDPFSFLYLSWTTLFPPGSGYQPTSLGTRLLVMAEGTSGLLIIGVTLAVLVARMPPRTQPEPPESSSTHPPQPTGDTRLVQDMTAMIALILAATALGGFTGGVLAGIQIFG